MDSRVPSDRMGLKTAVNGLSGAHISFLQFLESENVVKSYYDDLKILPQYLAKI